MLMDNSILSGVSVVTEQKTGIRVTFNSSKRFMMRRQYK
jgi:hypothetical protein